MTKYKEVYPIATGKKIYPIATGNVMTKQKLITQIAEITNVERLTVEVIVGNALNEIIYSLKHSGKIELRNFGVFKIVERKARIGRNPRTGEKVSIPKRKVVVFKPGLKVKKKIN